MPENMLTATEYMARIKAYGRTDEAYLQWHVQRFLRTKALFDERHPDIQDCRILDIGAHWLHQAMLYALDGHRLIAADVGGVLNVQSVRAMAADNDITLMRMGDLSDAAVFDEIDESSVDFVLFTEILEHLTFNPVGMWQAIQRVLKPTGEVIITTPNYYFWGSRAWDWSHRDLHSFPTRRSSDLLPMVITGKSTARGRLSAILIFCRLTSMFNTCNT